MQPEIIQLPKILDHRGNLTFIEGLNHMPFAIQRIFWIYDVPGGETRGGHAYKTSHEFIIALSGSFDVIWDSGNIKRINTLNRSYFGLYVPPGVWRHMENFSTNSLALVLSSTLYNKNEYIRDYDYFINNKINPESLLNSHKVPEQKRQHNINFSKNFVSDCYVINLDINHRNKGNITVIENHQSLPFNIQRVYYLYDIPGGVYRGAHAHKKLYQLIIAASGSFNVLLDDGINKKTITLKRPYQGLLVVPGIWEALSDFSSGAICLVIASNNYEENDYIRNYSDFIKMKEV